MKHLVVLRRDDPAHDDGDVAGPGLLEGANELWHEGAVTRGLRRDALRLRTEKMEM